MLYVPFDSVYQLVAWVEFYIIWRDFTFHNYTVPITIVLEIWEESGKVGWGIVE